MPSSFVLRTGAPLRRTPTHRDQAARRRLMLVLIFAAVALASGVAGVLFHPTPVQIAARDTGPFSYFPH